MSATPDAYFDERWAGTDDPWEQVGRHYETRKYDLTAAFPRRPRSRRAFEPGCATGLLTERLLTRCGEVVASDRHPRAAAVTAARVAHLPGAHVSTGQIPDDWPEGTFDLLVLSEVLYYLDAATLDRCLDRAVAALEPDGELVAVHYRIHVPEHALTGDEVHARLNARGDLHRWGHHLGAEFVLEGFGRA